MKRIKLLVPLVTVLALCMMFAAPVLADQHCDTAPIPNCEPCGQTSSEPCYNRCMTPGAALAVMAQMVTARIDYMAVKLMENPHYQAAKTVAGSTGKGMIVGGVVAGVDPMEGVIAGIDPLEGVIAGVDPMEGVIAGIDPLEGVIAGIDPLEGVIAGIDPLEGMVEAIDITGGVLGTLLGIPLPGPALFWGLVGGLDPVAGVIDMVDPVEGIVAAIDPIEGLVAAIDPVEGMVAAIDPVEGLVAAIDPVEGIVAAIDPAEGIIGAYHGAKMGMGIGLGMVLAHGHHVASPYYVACQTSEAEVSGMACAAVDQACDISA